jgi:ABC-2 type transport system ATP-binding protein
MLTAAHLTRRFGSRVAVDDLSLTLVPGEIFALLGPNGAGKTTTLRMLAGLIEPTSGDVELDGATLSHGGAPRLRARIGFLTEAPGLWDKLTVRRNLLVHARLHGLAAPGQAVDEALERFGLADRANQPAAELSKGLKQRVAIARTLLHDPEIVLLDEPTSGLDPESARDVRALILRLRDQGRSLLLSTHNLDEVERLADRVGVLRTRLIALDTPAALRTRLFGARVRIVLTTAAAPHVAWLLSAGARDAVAAGHQLSIGVTDQTVETPALVRRLVEAGAGIVSVTAEEAPLEQIYLRLLEQAGASQ